MMKVLNYLGLNTAVLILMHPGQFLPVINGYQGDLKWNDCSRVSRYSVQVIADDYIEFELN